MWPGRGLAGHDWQQIDAVERLAGGFVDARDGHCRGKKVQGDHRGIALLCALDGGGPLDREGHADAPLVGLAFVATQRFVVVAGRPAIVVGEHDHRVVVHAILPQAVEHLANRAVEGNGHRLDLVAAGRRQILPGGVVRPVGRIEGKVQEKRLVLVFANVVHRLVGEMIGHVGEVFLGHRLAIQEDLVEPAGLGQGEITPRPLEEAVVVGEPAFHRVELRCIAKMPFAQRDRPVARILQHGWQQGFGEGQAIGLAVSRRNIEFVAESLLVSPGEQARSAGTAHRA